LKNISPALLENKQKQAVTPITELQAQTSWTTSTYPDLTKSQGK
jgi:hypothetical protein